MSCKKGGFITRRHDNFKDFLTICLDAVCKDVESEPHLIPVTNETFEYRSANTQDDAKNVKTSQVFRRHEEAKKREYLDRILQIEHGSFTPLIVHCWY